MRVGRRRRGDVGDLVGLHDLEEVLLVLLLREHGGRRREGPHGGCARALGARVHVALVVVGHVDEVRPALGSAREGLDAHVEGAAVAREGHDGRIRPVQGGKPRRDPRGRGGRAREGVVYAGDQDRRQGVEPVEDAQAAGRKRHDRVFPERLQGEPVGDGQPAALAGPRTGQDVLLLVDLEEILRHSSTPCGNSARWFSVPSRPPRSGQATT